VNTLLHTYFDTAREVQGKLHDSHTASHIAARTVHCIGSVTRNS